MWKEFKEFAMRGNIMDLAVGVIIRRGFSKNSYFFGKRLNYACYFYFYR